MQNNKRPLTGVLYITAQERNIYEVGEANSDFLFQIVEVLESRFGLQAIKQPLDGIDVIYWDFAREEIKLTVGWDVWSGCFVFANCDAGDAIIQKIGQYFDGVFHELQALQKTDCD